MANNLFPVFDVPSVLTEDITTRNRYKRAPRFDIENGALVRDGSGHVLYSSGYDAWVLWCTKTIMTERWAHLGYSDNAGIEADAALREPDRKAQESALERTISEALLADPMGRTQQVRNFEFAWHGDSLEIACTVIGADGNSASITAKINT